MRTTKGREDGEDGERDGGGGRQGFMYKLSRHS